MEVKILNKHKAKVMKIAWNYAREAAEKFGGKASEYISGALKASWANLKKKIVEFELAHEIRENSVKVVDWFVRKSYIMQLAYNESLNAVVRETEKAVLLELNPMDKNDSIQEWVPKSCLVGYGG